MYLSKCLLICVESRVSLSVSNTSSLQPLTQPQRKVFSCSLTSPQWPRFIIKSHSMWIMHADGSCSSFFRSMGRSIQCRRGHLCFTWLWCQPDLPNTEERLLGANAMVQGHPKGGPHCPLSSPAWLPLCQWGSLYVTGGFHRNSWECVKMDSALKKHVALTHWEVWVQLYFVSRGHSD